MRYQLTDEQIEEFASRPGVRRIAVENFLGSMDYAHNGNVQRACLAYDAQLYGWNDATIRAILDGICMAEHGCYRDASGNTVISMAWVLANAEQE